MSLESKSAWVAYCSMCSLSLLYRHCTGDKCQRFTATDWRNRLNLKNLSIRDPLYFRGTMNRYVRGLLCNSFHAMYSVNVRVYSVEYNECILSFERWVVQEKRFTVCIGNLNIDPFLGPTVWFSPDDLPFYSNLASFPSIFQTKYNNRHVRPCPRKQFLLLSFNLSFVFCKVFQMKSCSR